MNYFYIIIFSSVPIHFQLWKIHFPALEIANRSYGFANHSHGQHKDFSAMFLKNTDPENKSSTL